MMIPGMMGRHGTRSGGAAKGPGRGTLKVTVIEGKNLRNTELIGKQDPYCVIKFGSTTKKTKVHKNGGKQATWNQIFEFDVDEQKMAKWVFQIAVWDKETFSDDLIGRKNFSLQEVLGNHGKGSMQYDIQHKGKCAGNVFMSVDYSGAPKPQPIVQPAIAPAVAPVVVPTAYTTAQTAQPVYTPQTAQPVQPTIYAPQQVQPVYAPQQAQPYQQPVYAGQQAGVYAGQPQQSVYAGQPQQSVYAGQPAYAPQQAQPVYQNPAPVYAGAQTVQVQPVPVQSTAQPVYQQAQPVYTAPVVATAAVATGAVATAAVVSGKVESKARGVNLSNAGTKAVNGYYSYKCQNDGVACYSKQGTNYHIMRHTQGSTTAWWVSEWKNGNKNNTVDFYFVESKSATPPQSGWRVDKYCKGRVPGPKASMA